MDAFDKLNPFYTSEKLDKDSQKIAHDLKSSYLTLESTLKTELLHEYSEKRQRLLPPQLTPQRLAEFLGAAGVTWIIEDFHKVNSAERQKLSQILKIFVDISNKYPTAKVIAIGAVGTAREIVNYDSELNNRVAEIHVPLMTKQELEDILLKGEKLLNVDFEPKMHEDMIKYSNSLASICHHICFSICYNNGVRETSKIKKRLKVDYLKDAVVDYLKQNSDSFKETLDRALKPRDGMYDNTKGVLNAFCKSNKDELTKNDVLNYKNNKSSYGGKKIIEYLNLLTTADYGEVLRFDENSGKYFFSNPFFKAYTIMQFSTDEGTIASHITESVSMEELFRILSRMEEMKVTIRSNAPVRPRINSGSRNTPGSNKSGNNLN